MICALMVGSCPPSYTVLNTLISPSQCRTPQLGVAAQELVDEEIWGRKGSPSAATLNATSGRIWESDELHFTHATLHRVALDSIPESHRTALHAAVLRALEVRGPSLCLADDWRPRDGRALGVNYY